MAFTSSIRNHGWKVFPGQIRGDVLLSPHMSSVANQMILIHTTVIMLQEIQPFLVSTFTTSIHQMNQFLCRKKLIQSHLLVSMRKIWMTKLQVKEYNLIIIQQELSINIMHHLYHQRILKMYLPYQNMIQEKEEYAVIKILFWVYYLKNQRVFNYRYHCYFLLSMT